ISNHGIRAADYSNVFSLHALSGVSKDERALSIAGLVNIIKREAKGAQIGLGYNLQSVNQSYAFEAGIGAHLLTKSDFTLNTEVSSLGLINFEGGMYNKGSLRILPAYKLNKGIELYAGPTASHIYTNTDEGKDLIKTHFGNMEMPMGK